MTTELNPNVQFRNLINDLSDTIDEAILHMLESHHPDDMTLASLAEARGNVVRVNHALKIVTIVVAEESPRTPVVFAQPANHLPNGAKPKPLDLPKLQKQPKPKNKDNKWGAVERPGISKLLKGAKDFDCPTCGALKGTPCFKFTSPGGRPTDERRPDNAWMHNKRQELARDHNNKMRARYDREHFTDTHEGENK